MIMAQTTERLEEFAIDEENGLILSLYPQLPFEPMGARYHRSTNKFVVFGENRRVTIDVVEDMQPVLSIADRILIHEFAQTNIDYPERSNTLDITTLP